MPKIISLYLLILCGIWSQGVIGSSSDEAIKESTNFHVRQKRVISRIRGEDKAVSVRNFQYIVHIKYENRIHCVGSILSHYVVITSASCIEKTEQYYHVVSASARSNRGNLHNVTDIRKHYGNHPYRPKDGIALLTVHLPFVYGRGTRNIELNSEPLFANTVGTVSGWGYNSGAIIDRGTDHPTDLRSIEVPILGHRECVNRYQPHIVISDVDICTFHPQKSCGHNDGGAPLVVNGYLAGVYLWTGLTSQYCPSYPDVFALLQHSAYNQWIRTNIRNIDSQFHNSSA